jgi:hypothetical protein
MYAMLPVRRGATLSPRLFLEFALPKLALALRNERDTVTRVRAWPVAQTRHRHNVPVCASQGSYNAL